MVRKLELHRDRFINLWLEGVSKTQISRELGVGLNTIDEWCRRLRLPQRLKGNLLGSVQVDHMRKQIEERLACQDRA